MKIILPTLLNKRNDPNEVKTLPVVTDRAKKNCSRGHENATL